jgi:hypothetical protein
VSRRSGYDTSIGNRRRGDDTSIGDRRHGDDTSICDKRRGDDTSIGDKRHGGDTSIGDKRRGRSMSANHEGTCSSFVFLEVRVGERFLVCFQELGGPCVREGEGYKYWAPALSEPNGDIVEDRSLLVRIC